MHSGIDRAHMDPTVRPQDDLFAHVNGTWLATARIPEDRSRYGSFDILRESAEAAVRDLIERAAEQQPELGTAAGKVGALYASFMDTERVDALGTDPLVAPLGEVAPPPAASISGSSTGSPAATPGPVAPAPWASRPR